MYALGVRVCYPQPHARFQSVCVEFSLIRYAEVSGNGFSLLLSVNWREAPVQLVSISAVHIVGANMVD